MKNIDVTKPLQTRQGWTVRIYAVDGGGHYPIHGAMQNPNDGIWVVERWRLDGSVFMPSCPQSSDLVNVPEKIERDLYINVYTNYQAAYFSRTQADVFAALNRLACVHYKLSCDVGEGLSG